MRNNYLSNENIPGGFNFLRDLCQTVSMESEIERLTQEIYDRIIGEIRKALIDSPKIEADLADLCSLEQPTINRIKSGARGKDLPFKTILKLSLALNIDLTTLFLSTTPGQAKLKTLLSEISKMIVNE
jgi:transcriptional regulator with XRE-family HTH domain